MFLDLTRGKFQYIQHQVSSIQHRRGKNDGLANTKNEEIKIFMQRWGKGKGIKDRKGTGI
jgi:hypothetical protein